MKTFADRLRDALETSGIGSQRQLAAAANIRPATITKWVQTEARGIRTNDLQAVAAVLGVSPRWLLSGEGERDQVVIPDSPSVTRLEIRPGPPGTVTTTQEGLVAELLMNIQADAQLTEDEKRQTTETLVRNLLKLGKTIPE